MSINKQYYKKKATCKVTFSAPVSETNSAKKAYVVGEFNNWSTSATPMKRSKKGSFTASLVLERGQEYQFRYLFDNKHWSNDAEADKLADTPYGDVKNSVVVI